MVTYSDRLGLDVRVPEKPASTRQTPTAGSVNVTLPCGATVQSCRKTQPASGSS
jgi:hypothetical protein